MRAAWMVLVAAIAHGVVKQATEQTTTSSTFANVSGCQIPAANLVTGGVYLLFVFGDLSINSSTLSVGCRVTHGGTAWADSEQEYDSQGATVRLPYSYVQRFTQAAGENIDVQLRSRDNVTTARLDNVVMAWIRTDVDLTADDYDVVELATDNALGTTFEDGASMTWTPVTSGDQWLVIGYQQVSMSAVTSQGEMQMVISGGATYTGGLVSVEGEATTNLFGHFFSRAIALTNVSTTLKIQGRSETANVFTHLHSRVVRLRLNKFRNFIQGFTSAELAGTTTAWADAVESRSLTPDVAGDVFAITCAIDDFEATGIRFSHRMQLDNADTIGDETTNAWPLNGNCNDATDQYCVPRASIDNVSAAAHTWDHDGYVGTAVAGRGYSERSMVIFTMELAAAGGGGPTQPPRTMHQHRLRRAA